MYQQRPRYWKDTKGAIEKYGARCIEEDFQTLTNLKILYAWRHPTKYDQARGCLVYGQAKKLTPEQRDLFGYDCAIIISRDVWKDLGGHQKHKLVWHELNHIDVPLDEASRPVEDDHGRVKFSLRKHDLNIERFAAEIEKFGPDPEERVKMRTISKLYKQSKAGVVVRKKRKKGKLKLVKMSPEEKLEKELGI